MGRGAAEDLRLAGELCCAGMGHTQGLQELLEIEWVDSFRWHRKTKLSGVVNEHLIGKRKCLPAAIEAILAEHWELIAKLDLRPP